MDKATVNSDYRVPAATIVDAGERRNARTVMRGLLAVPEVGALIPLLFFTALFAILEPALLNPRSIASAVRGIQFIAIIVVGQAILMIAGELDLSVGSVAALSAMVAAALIKHGVGGWQMPVWAAIVAALGVGMLVGLVNGLITVKVGVPAFITTLGMLYAARDASFLIQEQMIYDLSASFGRFGRARPLGVSWTFVILLILAVAADLAMRFTTLGRKIYATGGNREVARLAGINTDGVKIGCFMLTGTLAALAGVLLMITFNLGQPQTGIAWELDVIAAGVLGGTSLFGGAGTVAGACMGCLIMMIVRSGLVMTRAPTHWQGVAVGGIMVAAVAFDVLRRRAKIG